MNGNLSMTEIIKVFDRNDYASVKASFMPKYKNKPPVHLVNQCVSRVFCFNLPPIEDDDQANKWHQIMPLILNSTPKNIKASALFGASAVINCGTKARKNNATLGFKVLVRNP